MPQCPQAPGRGPPIKLLFWFVCVIAFRYLMNQSLTTGSCWYGVRTVICTVLVHLQDVSRYFVKEDIFGRSSPRAKRVPIREQRVQEGFKKASQRSAFAELVDKKGIAAERKTLGWSMIGRMHGPDAPWRCSTFIRRPANCSTLSQF